MAVTISGSTGIASVDGSAGSPGSRGTDANSGVFYSADAIKFSTGGTERAVIDNNGLSAAGHVIQVVSATYSTEVSTTSQDYSDTGLTCNITPRSSSNKILVLVSQPFRTQRSTTVANGGIRILRDSTVIVSSASLETDGRPYGIHIDVSGSGASETTLKGVWNRTYLDSPSSTSALTYKTQHATYNESNSNSFRTQYDSTVDESSYIILMEVAG